MKEISVGSRRYRLAAFERDGSWTARAFSQDSAERYGVECSGTTDSEAIGRLVAWLEWQQAHVAALEALQAAERAYHRTVTGSAFADRQAQLESHAARREALEALEAARRRLDELRARRPEDGFC